MTIQTIIDKFRLKQHNVYATVFQLSGYDKEQLKEKQDVMDDFLKDSLISMLDGIEKEAKDLDYYTQTTLSSGKKVNLVSKEEVINIINSHK